ncbi:MAG: cytochrome c maturation protein CcmE domain-containing protein [Mucilaginibacter sp.]|uniref:cytochrome c maturation protein CcmE domain-containing protein n=1 Tax=Mucilaginibacter sp. L3T2-6 TaxID=3062491 RepID=UPI002675BC56|nr:cytochrome c maturation protein CcmE [Mucilaginibacter sp. L3T2-6]MDO3642653.1 cytochrome c maturation protein CcmE [Mucilaginibacter sp. L3T2-6]MDV6217787.1 cytochrome c maturation protein CcmE [Mucilaginibacter sp. L3T2-6]
MKKSSILGLVVIAIAISVIIATYSKSSTYGSFSDARQTAGELRVVGQLDKGKELYYDATKDANYFSFFVKDNKGEECKVVFTGTKPQDFEKSEQIVLTGKMTGKEFHASNILMKCPSKYTKDKIEVTEAKAKTAEI